jgi:hypothetical protein
MYDGEDSSSQWATRGPGSSSRSRYLKIEGLGEGLRHEAVVVVRRPRLQMVVRLWQRISASTSWTTEATNMHPRYCTVIDELSYLPSDYLLRSWSEEQTWGLPSSLVHRPLHKPQPDSKCRRHRGELYEEEQIPRSDRWRAFVHASALVVIPNSS